MIYLDNAATSRYKPFKVMRSMAKETFKSTNPGRSAYRDAINSAMKIVDCRELICGAIGGDGDIIFTKNCTEALNLAIFGSNLRGQVITTVYEHNSVLRPLHRLKDEGKIELTVLKPESDGLISERKLLEALNTETSMFAIGETSNVLGVTQNLKELCSLAQKSGARVLVDAAQSMGHSNGTYAFADMVASSGHKGLHGPQGTGFLYIRKNVTISPLIYGGTGTSSTMLKQPSDMPEGFESGTLNTCGICGLYEGARWTFAHRDKINGKISFLAAAAVNGLKEIKKLKLYNEGENGIILFNLGKMPSMSVADTLNSRYGIEVRAGLHCAPLIHTYLGTLAQGAVRVSIGYNNKLSHIEALISGLKEMEKEL